MQIFAGNFTELLNKKYTLYHQVLLKNKNNEIMLFQSFLNVSSIVFAGSLLVALKRTDLLVLR